MVRRADIAIQSMSFVPLPPSISTDQTQQRSVGSGCQETWLLWTSSFLTTSLFLCCAVKEVRVRPPKVNLLCCTNGYSEEPRSALLRIAYQSAQLSYQQYTEGRCPPALELNGTGNEGISSCFAFSHLSGFAPIQMEVQRASNLRGEVPARVCLLGRDRAMYKTYMLPEALDGGKEQG